MTPLFFVLFGVILGVIMLLASLWIAFTTVEHWQDRQHRDAERLKDREDTAEKARRLGT